MSRPERVDRVSDFVKIRAYKGSTLTGPEAILSKKILATGPHKGTTNFGTTQFRLLGTSPQALVNSRLTVVLPLTFSALSLTDMDNATVVAAPQKWSSVQVAPRRNGAQKAMQSLSCTVNSSVSFSTRPDELECFDDIFSTDDMPYYQGGRSTGTLGPDAEISPQEFAKPVRFGGAEVAATNVLVNGWFPRHAAVTRFRTAETAGANWTGAVDRQPHVSTARRHAYGPLRKSYPPGSVAALNKGFTNRRTEFLRNQDRQGQNITMDYVTCLNIPPCSCYDFGKYQNTTTWLPSINSLDLIIQWKRDVLPHLLESKLNYQGDYRALRDYVVTWAENPYIVAEFCIPPYKIERPISLGAWRTTSYQQVVTVPAEAANPTAAQKLGYYTNVQLAQVRLDSFPVLLSIMATKRDVNKNKMNAIGTQQISRCGWRDTYCPMRNLSISLNEKQALLTDRTQLQMYKEFMRNTSSEMTYQQWSECRMQYVIRSDTLALEAGENIFKPQTMTISVDVGRAIDDRPNYVLGADDGTVDAIIGTRAYDFRVTMLYMSESLTVSSNAAAVNSLLLGPQDIKDAGIQASTDNKSALAEYTS